MAGFVPRSIVRPMPIGRAPIPATSCCSSRASGSMCWMPCRAGRRSSAAAGDARDRRWTSLDAANIPMSRSSAHWSARRWSGHGVRLLQRPGAVPGGGLMIDVWLCALDGLPDGLSGVIDETEREQVARFRHERDRRRFIARRGQVRLLLSDYLARAGRGDPLRPQRSWQAVTCATVAICVSTSRIPMGWR